MREAKPERGIVITGGLDQRHPVGIAREADRMGRADDSDAAIHLRERREDIKNSAPDNHAGKEQYATQYAPDHLRLAVRLTSEPRL